MTYGSCIHDELSVRVPFGGVIACIETPEVIERILTHLAARNTACIDYPRAPPLHAPEAQPPPSSSPSLS